MLSHTVLLKISIGKHATAYGRGVYFAKNSSYSHGYTDKKSGKVKAHIFLANVLIGNIAIGNFNEHEYYFI